MNNRQIAFYKQAKSDWEVFVHFHPLASYPLTIIRKVSSRIIGVPLYEFPKCQELHYLQMATEKLAKAYYKSPMRNTHDAFRRFMNDLPSNPKALVPLEFLDLAALTSWQGSVISIVDAIEDLAPAIADKKGLPNPEYPWPKSAPSFAPVDYNFDTEVYSKLDIQAKSGHPPFLRVVNRMIRTMCSHSWHL